MRKEWRRIEVLLVVFMIISLFSTLEAHSKVVVDVLKGDQDMTLYGDQVFDGLGYPVFAADINGDGIKGKSVV